MKTLRLIMMMGKIYTAKLHNFGVLSRDFTDLDLDPLVATTQCIITGKQSNQFNLL